MAWLWPPHTPHSCKAACFLKPEPLPLLSDMSSTTHGSHRLPFGGSDGHMQALYSLQIVFTDVITPRSWVPAHRLRELSPGPVVVPRWLPVDSQVHLRKQGLWGPQLLFQP